MTAMEMRNLFDTVRELVQYALDSQHSLDPVAGPLARRAIEYTTGKRSGRTAEDAIISIGKVVSDASKAIPVEAKRKIPSSHGMDGNRDRAYQRAGWGSGVLQHNSGPSGPDSDNPEPTEFDTFEELRDLESELE